jgi:hypothetical protein
LLAGSVAGWWRQTDRRRDVGEAAVAAQAGAAAFRARKPGGLCGGGTVRARSVWRVVIIACRLLLPHRRESSRVQTPNPRAEDLFKFYDVT